MFKKLHFMYVLLRISSRRISLYSSASGIFIIALFFHVSYTLTSWDFFLATLAVYAASWILQVARTVWTSGAGCAYTLTVLPDREMVHVAIAAPSRFTWAPGQHVFLRFVSGAGVHALSTHPFTIANAPEEGARMVDVVLRVRGGLTRALREMAEQGTVGRVLLDGPYGRPPTLGGYDRVCLLAGGSGALPFPRVETGRTDRASGATFTLSILMSLVQGRRDGGCKQIEFVLAVRYVGQSQPSAFIHTTDAATDSRRWMDASLARAAEQAEAAGITLSVRVFITGNDAPGLARISEGGDDIECGSLPSKKDSNDARAGRPHLPAVVKTACATASGGRVAIVGAYAPPCAPRTT